MDGKDGKDDVGDGVGVGVDGDKFVEFYDGLDGGKDELRNDFFGSFFIVYPLTTFYYFSI